MTVFWAEDGEGGNMVTYPYRAFDFTEFYKKVLAKGKKIEAVEINVESHIISLLVKKTVVDEGMQK